MAIGLFTFLDGLRDPPLLAGVRLAAQNRSANVVTFAAIDLQARTTTTAGPIRPRRWFHEQLNASSLDEIFPVLHDSVEGVIMAFGDESMWNYAAGLQQKGVPVVLVGREHQNLPCVVSDNCHAIRHAVGELARRGHRRIAFLGGPADNQCAQGRLRGFQLGMQDHALSADLVLAGEFAPDIAEREITALLQRDQNFTAVIAANDWTALRTLEVLQKNGRRVPDDVELIGFDNVTACRWSTPALSTYDPQLFQMGYLAAERLFDEIGRKPAAARSLVTPIYVPRATTREVPREFTGGQFLTEEWTQNRFRSELQLARLRRDERTASLIAKIEENASAPDTLAVWRRLVAELRAHGEETICLYPLTRIADPSNPAGQSRDAGWIATLLADGVFFEETRKESVPLRFAAATAPLRELSLVEAGDETVINRLESVFQGLNLHHAAVFLRKSGSDGGGPAGTWHLWQAGKRHSSSREDPNAGSTFDPKPLFGQASWLAFPVVHGEENYGLVAVDCDTEFLLQIPDLIRLLAATLHSVRLSTELRASQYFYHSLVESLPQVILRKDTAGRYIYANSGFAELIGRPLDELIGKSDADYYPADRAATFHASDRQVISTGQSMEYEDVIELNGRSRFMYVKKVPLYGPEGSPIGVQLLAWDMTILRETEAKLRQTQQELLEAARLAGVAEMATGVLHNIGNALNSVNTSAEAAATHIRQMRVPGLVKATDLLAHNHERLAEFLTSDPRGRQLPEYLSKFSAHLQAEQHSALQEIAALREAIEHTNQIVAAQQGLARVSETAELVSPGELLESALRINEAALTREGVIIRRELSDAPMVRAPRHKVLQILANVIRNASEAMRSNDRTDRQLSVSLGRGDQGQVRLAIADNGTGIPPENLTRIFQLGFTTKKDGHGFGLHASAVAAQEIGGSLTAASPGPGHGATFILEIPPAEEPSQTARRSSGAKSAARA